MKNYFVFKLRDTAKTTTGEPNPRTGRMSIAGTLICVSTKRFRDRLVSEDKKGCFPVNRKTARRFLLGMRLEQYRQYVDAVVLYGEEIFNID